MESSPQARPIESNRSPFATDLGKQKGRFCCNGNGRSVRWQTVVENFAKNVIGKLMDGGDIWVMLLKPSLDVSSMRPEVG